VRAATKLAAASVITAVAVPAAAVAVCLGAAAVCLAAPVVAGCLLARVMVLTSRLGVRALREMPATSCLRLLVNCGSLCMCICFEHACVCV